MQIDRPTRARSRKGAGLIYVYASNHARLRIILHRCAQIQTISGGKLSTISVHVVSNVLPAHFPALVVWGSRATRMGDTPTRPNVFRATPTH